MRGAAVSADSVAHKSLQSEIMEWELVQKRRGLIPEERHRLAQLYFLSSDCLKVKSTLATDPQSPLNDGEKDLSCACDGKCDLSTALDQRGRKQEALYAFRQLIGGGASLQDSHVNRLWQRLEQEPEARYVLFQSFKNSKSLKEQQQAQEYLRSLKSFDVGI